MLLRNINITALMSSAKNLNAYFINWLINEIGDILTTGNKIVIPASLGFFNSPRFEYQKSVKESLNRCAPLPDVIQSIVHDYFDHSPNELIFRPRQKK